MGGQVNDGTHRNISVPKGDMKEQLFDENVKTEAGINKTGVCQLQDTFQHGGFKVFPKHFPSQGGKDWALCRLGMSRRFSLFLPSLHTPDGHHNHSLIGIQRKR